MNARNLEYLRPLNYKRAIRIADDKLQTKEALLAAEIPTPKLYGVIRDEQDLASFDWEKLPDNFVLKPTHGHGGGGIVVVFRRKQNGMWVGPAGREIAFFDLLTHIFNILDGQFSLANSPDSAFFEERIKISTSLKPYAFGGIPDIRVIVFNRIPVMSMLRLPTSKSDGKANLAVGGIGVGVDISTGVTTTAMMKSGFFEKRVEMDRHPDTNMPLAGVRIPYWDEILEIAIRCQDIVGLGYIGVDIALDKERGPMVLEVNARPGLSIQNANLAPLGERLRRVSGLKIKTLKKGVRLAKELFGGEIQEEVESITGRHVVGIFEDVLIEGKDATTREAVAKIDTGAYSTSLDIELAKELGFGELIAAFERLSFEMDGVSLKDDDETIEKHFMKKYQDTHPDLQGIAFVRSSHGYSFRPKVAVTVTLSGKSTIAKANIVDRSGLRYRVIIGRRDLKSFLVDPQRV